MSLDTTPHNILVNFRFPIQWSSVYRLEGKPQTFIASFSSRKHQFSFMLDFSENFLEIKTT